MFLEARPLAEVPGFTQAQLEQVARNVEARRQQLEAGIEEYIRSRQEELCAYENELLSHHDSMASACDDKEPAAAAAASEKPKHTKHTRIQKREQELYGLVTPVFLPLLDARDTPDDLPPRDVRKTRDMDGAPRKSRRASSSSSAHVHVNFVKKSALRTTQNKESRPRRKRVSLVVGGQTVLPADIVASPEPSSDATTSTSTSDDVIDPRLTGPDTPNIHMHSDAVPLPLSKSHTIPPESTPHTVLAPSPTSPVPVDAAFDTYVGGLTGSGIDDVEQAGSVGYPSSLGASYLESYMQSRPLRVRMEAADRVGLDERETEGLMKGREGEGEGDMEVEEEGTGEDGDGDVDMDIMGEMEGF